MNQIRHYHLSNRLKGGQGVTPFLKIADPLFIGNKHEIFICSSHLRSIHWFHSIVVDGGSQRRPPANRGRELVSNSESNPWSASNYATSEPSYL
jgi:hypothetical protein